MISPSVKIVIEIAANGAYCGNCVWLGSGYHLSECYLFGEIETSLIKKNGMERRCRACRAAQRKYTRLKEDKNGS